jgi:hypothetical protein
LLENIVYRRQLYHGIGTAFGSFELIREVDAYIEFYRPRNFRLTKIVVLVGPD